MQYERPEIIATYRVDELQEEAAVCFGYDCDRPNKGHSFFRWF